MEFDVFVHKLFQEGLAAGLTDMEVYQQTNGEFEVKVFEQELDSYTVSQSGGLSFRGKYAGKFGYAYTEKLDEAAIQFLVENAVANAKVVDSDDVAEIFAGSSTYPSLKPSGGIRAAASDKIAFAKELEATAKSLDKRVRTVDYCLYGDQSTEVRLVNTKGLDLSHSDDIAFAYVSVVVSEGEETKTASRFQVSPRFDQFDGIRLAKAAVAEAISLLGAKSVPSRTYPVILRHDAAADLLQTFSSVFSAEAAQKGLSLLAERVGEAIAGSNVTIVDDPLLAQGPSSVPFDAEGVATRTKRVVEAGVLTTLLHNLKTAAKEGVESTGNGVKGSYKGVVKVAPSNFYVQPGTLDLEQLVQQMHSGLVIIDLQGLHSGANAVSGDFSLAAKGYLVEAGKIVSPVEQITLAGNFYQMLKQIVAVGSDLKFGLPSAAGTYGAPSVLVEGLAVSGD